MPARRANDLIEYIRRIALEGDGASLSDGDQLRRFLDSGEGAAFAQLVRRHGPMVWGVCRRILHNHQDAEDVFQATFLVLLRKAASIQPRERIGNWLHGVALRTARKAMAMAARRAERERHVSEMPEPLTAEQRPCWDLLPLLDQELSRLPDKYRAVIVLCDLEGRTRKEAAQHLRVPEGTVAGRLARARALLAKRLSRHGLGLIGASLPAILSQDVETACVPVLLVSRTISAATLLAAGQSAATGVISAQVASLTKGVLKLMLLTKLKTATVLLAVATAGAGVMTLGLAQSQSTSPVHAQEKMQQKSGPESHGPASAAMVQRLIGQFASPRFAEREAAARELRRIGEPALAPLREAALGSKEPEFRRRAEETARGIADDAIERLLKEEAREDEIYSKKVAKILERVTDLAKQQLHADRETATPRNVPFLTNAYLRLARARKRIGESAAAADAYQQAEYYCNGSGNARTIRHEMLPLLIPIWEKAVQERIAQDPALKALAARCPVVLLHSRHRYADGGYLQSTYSFLHETADERKHHGDVQLQFDNGGGDGTFQVNMATNQKNTVVDLGNVDFTMNPSSAKADFEGPDQKPHQAIPGHVYLEKVADTNGNRFFVVFKVVAVDEQSRYMAFLWRCLPGGTMVRRH